MSETLRALLLKIEHELTTECGLVVTDKPGEYDDALQSGCDASGARDCQAAVSWKIDHAELLDEIAAALRSLPGAVTGGVTDGDVSRALEVFHTVEYDGETETALARVLEDYASRQPANPFGLTEAQIGECFDAANVAAAAKWGPLFYRWADESKMWQDGGKQFFLDFARRIESSLAASLQEPSRDR